VSILDWHEIPIEANGTLALIDLILQNWTTKKNGVFSSTIVINQIDRPEFPLAGIYW
jgi:hypothetical protein